jgi:sterol desaturase/sphingolipid hydroxylase (fatty acid hydroxylase superfamily)
MAQTLLVQALAFAKQVASLSVWLVGLTLIFLPLERFFALHRRKRGRRLAADLGYYVLNSLAPTLIMAAPLSLLAAAVRAATPDAYLAVLAALPLWAKLVAALLIGEVGSYWGHRLSHQVPFLWRFHVIHHAPEHVDWLINTRAHPLDVVFTRLSGLVPIYALSLAQPSAGGSLAPVLLTLFGTFWAFFIHANVRWRFGPLEHLIATPAFHHWHHTNDEHRDHNYTALFPFVDRLFGTYYLPRAWPPRYGVDEPPPSAIVDELLHPLSPPTRPLAAKSAPAPADQP